jgi:pSer/pThr/pTyr-binding forkhead associated (FHA) protein
MPGDISVESADPTTWPVLKPASPKQDPRSIRVNRLSCVIGDRSRVHLPLRSLLVSRSHALVIIDQKQVYVRDLASRNRLFVNGLKVKEHVLSAADLLQIGPFQFRCDRGFTRDDCDGDALQPRARITMNGAGREYAIADRTFLIGRRDECDLSLDNPSISQVHAVIFRRAGQHFVRDLNSRTGTFINGQRVREAKLDDGDEVRLGATALHYKSSAASDAQAPTAADDSSDDVTSDSATWASVGDLSSMATASVTVGYPANTNRVQLSGNETNALPAAVATAEDFGFGSEVSSHLRSPFESTSEPDLATAGELFPSELSLPSTQASDWSNQ